MPWSPRAGGSGKPSRFDLRNAGVGLITETYPYEIVSGGDLVPSGTIRVAAVGLRAGDIVTNVCVAVSVVAAGLTLAKAGLYDGLNNLLAASASAGTITILQGTTGRKQIPLSAPFTITADGVYQLALIQVGTTPATLARGVVAPNANALGTGIRPFTLQGGQADLTNPLVPADSGSPDWFGCN
jgi:hypothetical protein